MKRIELLNILEKVKPGIASNDLVESMTYFLFSKKDIITYNDKISIQHPLKTEFNLFVKAKDLYKIVSTLTTETISLTEKKGKLNIKSKSINANLSTIEDPEILARIKTVDKSLKNAKWEKLPDNFNESISLCSFNASNQEADKSLTCVYINNKDCVASDNHKIAHSILSETMETMLIKASEIKNLIAINPIEYSTSKAWLHFRNEDKCIFSIRRVDGEFPDFFPFFDFEGDKINLSSNMLEGMNLTSVLIEQENPFVTIKIAKGFCNIFGKSDAGKIQHRSKIDYKGKKEISFIINPEFLKEMMSHSSSITVSKERAKLQTDSDFSLLTSLYA